ncbi:MAG: (2Fe-2S)-binding protein, partial [Gemmatimonadota bacterium]
LDHARLDAPFDLDGRADETATRLGHDASLERIACAALSGNLCRCGTHPKIIRAVRRAARVLRSGDAS